MITKVTTQAFKRFASQAFPLEPVTLLAGPNNSGKTTLLQAIMVWNLALQRWSQKKGPESKSKASERTGVPITRQEFNALPLPSMDQLWTDTHTSLRKGEVAEQKPGAPRLIVITLEGKSSEGADWKLGFEFRYQGPEQIYIRPVAEHLPDVELARQEVSVIYVPPFSGSGVQETRYDAAYQDMLVGQGKGGDILRNLLLEVYQRGACEWNALQEIIRTTFHYRLLEPRYNGAPYITCEYVQDGASKQEQVPLDIAAAGSGFRQVLLVLAFLFARPSSLILLDEPDAHLHVHLQDQLYKTLVTLCRKNGGQLVIATHSEVLIDGTDPQRILSFYGEPHALSKRHEREQIREALKRVTSLELLQARNARGVLYLEGDSDFSLLQAWAEVLEHPLRQWFCKPFWHNIHGSSPKEAKGHFFAMKAVCPGIEAVLLLDGDNRDRLEEAAGEGIQVLRWERYEAESYLLHPDSLSRFFESQNLPLFGSQAMQEFRDQMPPAFLKNPLETIAFLRSEPASKTLLPRLLEVAGVDLPKREYAALARQMLPAEIPREVVEKLDAIHEVVG